MRAAGFGTDDKHYAERILRGINQHTLTELMNDAIRLGFITQAEFAADFMSKFVVGSTTDDAMRKYMDTLAAVNRPATSALSNERA
jgi:hypothetical protein